jgi:hypothetical protein
MTSGTDERRNEASGSALAMSSQDIAERFPYGLPASLHWCQVRSSNIVDLEQWRRRSKKGPAETE